MDRLGAETDENDNETFVRSVASPFAGPDKNWPGIIDSGPEKWTGRSDPFSRKIAHQRLWNSGLPSDTGNASMDQFLNNGATSWYPKAEAKQPESELNSSV